MSTKMMKTIIFIALGYEGTDVGYRGRCECDNGKD